MASVLSIHKYRLKFDFVHGGSPFFGGSTISTSYADSAGAEQPLTRISVSGSSGNNLVSFTRAFGVTTNYTVAYSTTGTLELIFTDVTLGASGSFNYAGYELIYNGTTLETGAAGNIIPLSTNGGAAGYAVIGLGPHLFCSFNASMVGGFDFKLTSSDSWTTLPVMDPPGVLLATGATNSGNLTASSTTSPSSNYETRLFSNQKAELKRWNPSDFKMRLSRQSVPNVDSSLNGVHTQRLAAITNVTQDIGGTKSAFETDVLERDLFLGVTQNGPGGTYIFPSRVNGSATNVRVNYLEQVADRWRPFGVPPSTPTVNGVVQNANYSITNRFQILGDGSLVRLNFGTLQGPLGILTGKRCTYSNVTSRAYSSLSASLYSAPAGSVTVSAGSVSFTGGVARIDLASMTVPPFMYGVLADSITFTPTGTDLKYYLEDAAGNRRSVPPPPDIDLRVKGKRNTCGSWKQDWGTRALRNSMGIAVPDSYDDIPANGVSGQIWPLVSAERAIGSQYGLDGTWAALVIVGTGTISITHPVLSRTSSLYAIVESPDATLIGTGTRWARLGGAQANVPTPSIDLPGFPVQLIRWLGWKRLVLEGVARNDGLNAELISYGFAAGSTPANRHFVEDTKSTFFYGSYAHPHFLWSPLNGNLEQVPGATLDRREYAKPGAKGFGFGGFLRLKDSTGTVVSTDGTPVGTLYPTTWLPTTWAKDHTLEFEGKDVALVRPAFCFTGATTPPLRRFLAIANCRAPWPQYNEAVEDSVSGDLDSLREQWSNPSSAITDLGSIKSGVELQGTDIAMAELGSSPLWVAYAYGGQTYFTQSFDDGQTWSPETMILDNALYPVVISGVPDLVFGMRPDSEDEPGTLVGISREPGETSWSAVFTLTSGGTDIRVENEPFDVCSEANGTALVLVAREEGGTGISRWLSYDGGRTWTVA